MNTDTPERVTLIPIERIEVLNSRDRNAKVFEEIVENIQDIGLKKPITVTEREGLDSEPKYLLVCGDYCSVVHFLRFLVATRVCALPTPSITAHFWCP
ncbi:hypothetical protein N9W92_06185 [Planktomarina temperata]|nr:hypothetical protein [Planktomarina temperata]